MSALATCSRRVALPARRSTRLSGLRALCLGAPLRPRALPVLRAAPSALAESTLTELAQLSATTAGEASEFILAHPVAAFAVAAAALWAVPKLVEWFVRYLALPIAVALVAFYTLEFPEDAAAVVTSVLSFANDNPAAFSVLVIGLAVFGLVPALATGLGATALIYVLLTISFGTQLPAVQKMQSEFSETVARVQVVSKVAGTNLDKLLP